MSMQNRNSPLTSIRVISYRFFITLFSLCLIFTLSGCSKGEIIADEEGNPIMYSLPDLKSGIYVQFSDGMYRRPLTLGMHSSGSTDETDNTRMVWLKESLEYLIPEVGGKDSLVFLSPEKPPERMYLEHYSDTCYSFGALFSTDENGSISFPSSERNRCSGTAIDLAIENEVDSARETIITELGNAEDINAPFSNGLLSDLGYVNGLTKGAMYKIGYYEGTTYNYFYVAADTHIYRQDGSYPVMGFTPTKDGYFIIELPEELPSGLYCINGFGVFNYTAGYAPSMGDSPVSDDSVIPTSTLPPEELPIQDTIGANTDNPRETPPQNIVSPTPAITPTPTPMPTSTPAMLEPQ